MMWWSFSPLSLLLIFGAVERLPVFSEAKECLSSELEIEIESPRSGFHIANAEIDLKVGVRRVVQLDEVAKVESKSCAKVEDPDESICLRFDENEAQCGVLSVSYDGTISYLEATLSNVHPGDHVLRAWISNGDAAVERRIDHHGEQRVSFVVNRVTRPWWKEYIVPPPSVKNGPAAAADTKGNVPSASLHRVDADYELLPHLLGPRTGERKEGDGCVVAPVASLPRYRPDKHATTPTALRKHLVGIFVGSSSVDVVDANILHLGFKHFSIVVFNYDGCDLRQFSWFDSVVVVTARRQMKWWFIKRFVAPQMMAAYEYLLVVDGDCDLTTMNTSEFVRDMSRRRVTIGQPAHGEGSYQPQYPFLRSSTQPPHVHGRWLNFIESGPLVAFSRDVWQCVWDLLQPDLTSGYGYDLVWSSACGRGRAAILYDHTIIHINQKSASRRPNFVGRAVGEAHEFFRRISVSGLGPVTPSGDGGEWA